MKHNEESTHLGKEVQFAVLGRNIADHAAIGQDTTRLVEEASILRRLEHEITDRSTMFAALTRQIGDAARTGRDTAPLILRLVELRYREVHGGGTISG